VALRDGTKSGHLRLPARAGWFAGIGAPVEKIYPCLVPFLELEDGRTIAAADGTDEIKPPPMVKASLPFGGVGSFVGANAGVLVDPGWFRKVKWTLEGNTLRRKESLTPPKA